MELITIIGYIGTLTTIFIGILFTTRGDSEAILRYFDLASIFITLGGSFGAMISMHYTKNVKLIGSLALKVLSKREEGDGAKTIASLISFSEKARREGLLSLEDDIGEMEEPFFQKALQLVIDGTDPEVVKQILSEEINMIAVRHEENRKMFEDLADLSPAFGLVGTLIGLVFALGSIGGDITVLGQGMSTALLTTLYGTILANGIWTPVANKLLKKTNDEVFNKELILEGILAIQFGDNPRILQQKLLSYFPEQTNGEVNQSRPWNG